MKEIAESQFAVWLFFLYKKMIFCCENQNFFLPL
jgi:hypothetical protein